MFALHPSTLHSYALWYHIFRYIMVLLYHIFRSIMAPRVGCNAKEIWLLRINPDGLKLIRTSDRATWVLFLGEDWRTLIRRKIDCRLLYHHSYNLVRVLWTDTSLLGYIVTITREKYVVMQQREWSYNHKLIRNIVNFGLIVWGLLSFVGFGAELVWAKNCLVH